MTCPPGSTRWAGRGVCNDIPVVCPLKGVWFSSFACISAEEAKSLIPATHKRIRPVIKGNFITFYSASTFFSSSLEKLVTPPLFSLISQVPSNITPSPIIRFVVLIFPNILAGALNSILLFPSISPLKSPLPGNGYILPDKPVYLGIYLLLFFFAKHVIPPYSLDYQIILLNRF